MLKEDLVKYYVDVAKLTEQSALKIASEFEVKHFKKSELILKEKDYRAALQTTNWDNFKECFVAIICSVDAIVPMWAYMLAASYLQPVAENIVFGNEAKLIEDTIIKNIEALNIEDYLDKRVVVKGCGEKEIAASAYVSITQKLKPVVKSLMYGEPCSTVPIYKKSSIK